MDEELTIAAVVARCGLPESTLRYWERIGLTPPVARDPSSGHRRYCEEDVVRLETLANAVITRPGVFAEVAHSSQRRSRRRGCRALCEDARSRGLTTVAGGRDRPYVAMARINGPGSGASALAWNTTLVAPASPRSRIAFATTSASSSASTLTGGSMYTTT